MKKNILCMILLSTMATAGGNALLVSSPVAPVVKEVKNTGIYAGVALTYNRVYAENPGWFDASKTTQDQLLNITGILGYTFMEYLGVEGRVSKTITEEDYSTLTDYSIFLKPQYRFRDRDDLDNDDGYITVYGLIGVGGVDVTGYKGNVPAHSDVIGKTILNDVSFQWGFGLSYTLVKKVDDARYGLKDSWSIFADYTSLIVDGSIDSTLYSYDSKVYKKLSIDGLTVGILYAF